MIQSPISTQHRGYAGEGSGVVGRTITRQGDAGWGVATSEPRWSQYIPVFKEDKRGVRRLTWKGTRVG